MGSRNNHADLRDRGVNKINRRPSGDSGPWRREHDEARRDKFSDRERRNGRYDNYRGSHGYRRRDYDDRRYSRRDRYSNRGRRPENYEYDRRPRRRSRSRSPSPSTQIRNDESHLSAEEIAEKRAKEALTKAMRTVFVSQLQIKTTKRDLTKYFRSVCDVRGVELMRDRRTGRSLGIAYIEVATMEDVPKALALNARPFVFRDGHKGFPIVVKQSQAELNYSRMVEKEHKEIIAPAGSSAGRNSSGGDEDLKKIYISNLPRKINDDDLMKLCAAFGECTRVDLVRDDVGMSKGFAFAHFSDRAAASLAMKGLDGLEVMGRALNVNRVKVKGISSESAQTTWSLDDDTTRSGHFGGQGVAISALVRSRLMERLAGGAGSELLSAHEAIKKDSAAALTRSENDIAGDPSQFLLLTNMFDPANETEPNWEEEIRVDIQEECARFGKVLQVKVMTATKGDVCVAFRATSDAEAAARALHDRWFGKMQVKARFLSKDVYLERVPSVRLLL